MRYPGFVGPSNQALSIAIDDERTINLMPMENTPGTGRSPWALVNTPGLKLACAVPTGPMRALFSQDGRTFTIGGDTFYEVTEAAGVLSVVARGTVVVDEWPACIVSNGDVGHQLLITSGGKGYIYDLLANTFAALATVDADFPAAVVMAEFLDGFGLVLEKDTSRFYISDIYDFSKWDPLDLGKVSQSADRTRAMIVVNRELFLFGSQRTTVWYDSGNPDFPFEPLGGGFIEQGILAPFSAARVEGGIIWVGGGERGVGAVYRSQQFAGVRISTTAIDHYLRKNRNQLEGAIGWTYAENGHTYYVLLIEGAETSLVYDASTNLWHERAIWELTASTWLPHVGRCHAFGFNRNLVGDRRIGALYDQSLDYVSEELRVA
jgi:hypothetical protein